MMLACNPIALRRSVPLAAVNHGHSLPEHRVKTFESGPGNPREDLFTAALPFHLDGIQMVKQPRIIRGSKVEAGRDFMMDRFLPAAQAMATGSTPGAPKKAAKVENTIDNGDRRLAVYLVTQT
ncbi:hypothetical protein HPP92_005915 [Vanilla planifolia]|uniref:Uncharacterized protein n=1 Tax=Vanilla planifolia TaxID=51239 RepID=A0A835VFV3_VANPL|nr:hypothetical protein HPP92_006197 [Vanilla planifolia]KAG0494921.1 hypothetical protein HPP92_005915 [Vanilla planifolia]